MDNQRPSDGLLKEIEQDPLNQEHRCRIFCKVMRLTLQEGLEYMKKCGFEIKADRYHQLMTEVNKRINKRLLYEAQIGFIEQHFSSIDMIETLMRSAAADLRYLEDKHDTRSIYAKNKIREEMIMNIPLITSYKERTQYVMEMQLRNRKLVKEVGAPEMAAPDTVKMTKELAKELGMKLPLSGVIDKVKSVDIEEKKSDENTL